jgi:hypothetical protein
MAKTLELQFGTEQGGTTRLTVDNPKEPVDNVTVKASMEQIVAAGIFYGTTGLITAVKGARLIERNVTDFEIV